MTWGTVGGNERTVAVENPENDMVCELADFCEAVNGDAVAIEHANMWADVTLASLEVMDQARAQAGIRFPADDGPRPLLFGKCDLVGIREAGRCV